MHARVIFIVAVTHGVVVAATVSVQPSFLILFPDQWRSDWDGSFHGVPLRMPVFESIAVSGTRFVQAYVPSPLCAPSRAALASGREYDEAGVPDNTSVDYNTSIPTFYSLLRAAGYHTMTVGKDDLTKASGCGDAGNFHAAALGFSDYSRCKGKQDAGQTAPRALPSCPYGHFLAAHNVSVNGTSTNLWSVFTADDATCCVTNGDGVGTYLCRNPTLMPQPAYEDDYVADEAVALLARKPAGMPWFLQVSFPGPHPPFIVTAEMRNSTDGRTFPGAIDNERLPTQQGQVIRRDYAAELEHLDTLMGRVLDAVPAAEMDNVIVIVASDHGEMLGDHDDWGKIMPWQGSISVPLVVSAPALGVPVNTTVSVPVATMDIAGTVLDYAGVARAFNSTTQSLRPFLSVSSRVGDAVAATAPYTSSYRPFVSSGLDAWRLVVRTVAVNTSTSPVTFKFICCKGDHCIGQPANATSPQSRSRQVIDASWHQRVAGSTAPAGRAVSRAEQQRQRRQNDPTAALWTELLYDVVRDPFDLDNVAAAYPAVVSELRGLLPFGWCRSR